MKTSIYVMAVFCSLCSLVGYSSSTDKHKCKRVNEVDIVDKGQKCKAKPDCVAVKHNDKVYWHSKSSATPDYKIDFKSGSPFSDSNIHSDDTAHTVTMTCADPNGCSYEYSITRKGQADSCEDPTVQIIPDRHISPPAE